MKLTASLSIEDQTRICQVSVDLEFENQVTSDILSARTCELLKGLQTGITNAMSGNPLKNITPSADPNRNVAQKNQTGLPIDSNNKRKQQPGDQPSPGQRKYINDLLRKNGLDLAAWCQEKNVPENQITAADCQQWIPELKDRLVNNKNKS